MDKNKTGKPDADEKVLDATETSEETTEEATGEDESSSTELDYDAEIEAEKQRGKPDPEIAREAFKKRQEKKKEQEEEDEEIDDEDKPLTRRDLARVREEVKREVYGDRIGEIAHELADTPKEAALYVAMHKNRQFPEGTTLKEQLQEMRDIVEGKKLRAKNGELARALKAKDNVSKDSASTYRDAQPGTAPKMDASTTAAYTRAGFAYDTKDRLWKKKLPNGNFLVKDSKTGVTRMVQKS